MRALRWVGGAGTGKTTSLMRLVERLVGEYGSVMEVGFASFSRGARGEIVRRLGETYGIGEEALRRDGWFRTIHSICYQQVGCKSGGLLVGDTAAGRKWLAEHLQAAMQTRLDDETGAVTYVGDCLEAKALNLWSLSRNSLWSTKAVCDLEREIHQDSPDYEDILPIIRRYETAKRVSHVRDFTDLLLAFAGIKASPEGYTECSPEGEVPEVKAWLIDEAQDLSPLTARIVERLAYSPTCDRLVLVGDPFQSIYGFSGATPKPFMEWPVADQKVMPKSYRCPAVVSQLGEQILRGCSDYWDRGIAPASHDGEVSMITAGEIAEIVCPGEDWLVIARANYQVASLARDLDDRDIPHRSTKIDSVSQARRGMRALHDLEGGKWVDPVEFACALSILPSRGLLEWGAKTKFNPDDHEKIHVTTLTAAGGLPALQAAVFSGEWASLVDGGVQFRDVADRHGAEEATFPSVRIGTIHSVKGAEADNVVLLTSSCSRFASGAEHMQSRADEERRLGYVGVTRARRRLFVASDQDSQYVLPGFD